MENTGILKEWFDRVDSEKSGSIIAPQLQVDLLVFLIQRFYPLRLKVPIVDKISGFLHDQNALAVGNLNFPLSIVQQMIRMYDFDRNGTMSFEGKVCSSQQLQQAFSDLERGRGYLVPEDVYEALVKIGFTLDSPAFYTVCESFDQKKNGRFRLDDFISLCIFVQSARNLFNSFDTAKQGRVTLDLNQFVYCTANCRI
ncbi:hypothetical protein SDJN02_27614 [Cucurbita argyrosperma subsp. argyrosperma]|nr:hypothetical protein SDJN02_27614 [Cucurbita argyrosperma subsp. argyrosperma]